MLHTVITELFLAIDRSDWNTLTELCHPDIVYERPGYPAFSGIERVLTFYREERILASGQHSLERIVIDQEYGACWGRFVGFKKDGTPADVLFSDVYRFEQGKIITRRSYFFSPSV